MHCMTESATAEARRRRRDTALRITVAAQRLTEQHGIDGFTLEDLAGSVGVSRRTLFNHVPGKLDAVLGPVPVLDPDLAATFVAGGPSGDLVEDTIVLAHALVDTSGLSRDDLERGRRLLLTEARLIARAHQRFDELSTGFGDLVLAREGEEFGRERALLLVRVLVCTWDVALDRLLADEQRSAEGFADLLATTIREVRGLFT